MLVLVLLSALSLRNYEPGIYRTNLIDTLDQVPRCPELHVMWKSLRLQKLKASAVSAEPEPAPSTPSITLANTAKSGVKPSLKATTTC